MLILHALRTRARVLATQARIALGARLLPAADRGYFKAKGLALIALHWRGLAQACDGDGDGEGDNRAPGSAAPVATAPRSAGRWARTAADSADRALLAMADAGIVSGDLHSALLSFAAHPERWRPVAAADEAASLPGNPAQGR